MTGYFVAPTSKEDRKRAIHRIVNGDNYVFPAKLLAMTEVFYENCIKNEVKPHYILEDYALKAGLDPFLPWQKSYIDSVLDTKNLYVKEAVVGYTGCRKTSTNAMVILWLMILAPVLHPVKIRITSPTGSSSKFVTFNEINQLINKFSLRDCFDHVDDVIKFAGDEGSTMGFIKNQCLPMDDLRSHSLRGFHSQGVMAMFFDEAIKFSQDVYHSCAGNMVPVNKKGRCLWCINSNATEGSGYFVDRIFLGNESDWHCRKITVDEVEDEIIKAAIIKNAKASYGYGSAMYRAILYCDFPIRQGNCLFSGAAIAQLGNRDGKYEHAGYKVVLAVDVASGVGRAKSAICIRDRHKVILWREYNVDTRELKTIIIKLAQEYDAHSIIIDANGLGHTTAVDLEYDASFHVVRFIGHRKATDEMFDCLRTQAFWESSKWVMEADSFAEISPAVKDLMYRIKLDDSSSGKITVTSKDALKKLTQSPEALDLLDAFVMTFSPNINLVIPPRRAGNGSRVAVIYNKRRFS